MTLAPYYECQTDNLYIRSDRRKTLSVDHRITLICEQLKKAGPLALLSEGLMIENGVYGVDFNTGIVMFMDKDCTTFVCYNCHHTLQKHIFDNIIQYMDPEIIKACLLSINRTPCGKHGIVKIHRCPDCEPSSHSGWYKEEGCLSRCDYDDDVFVNDDMTYNDDNVIRLLHSCWANVFKVSLKDNKIASIVYTSNKHDLYTKCFKCKSETEGGFHKCS